MLPDSSFSRQQPPAPKSPIEPLKLLRQISGHKGWIRCLAIDPENKWIASGSADSTIKLWEIGTGKLKLTLTGHISTVRALSCSDRHPYLFSVGEDKKIKCWDLETNKVVRQFHGHLSGIHSLTTHPTLDLIITGSRDSTAKVWDIRSRQAVYTLSGHKETVSSILAQPTTPQIITSSLDSTIRLWDLRKAETIKSLTHHKRSIRCLANHPTEYSFISSSPDSTKRFILPDGDFLHNIDRNSLQHTMTNTDTNQHQPIIINSIAINDDSLLASVSDCGHLFLNDTQTGHLLQKTLLPSAPGSIEGEEGLLATAFDRTGLRLIIGGMDKTIKIFG